LKKVDGALMSGNIQAKDHILCISTVRFECITNK